MRCAGMGGLRPASFPEGQSERATLSRSKHDEIGQLGNGCLRVQDHALAGIKVEVLPVSLGDVFCNPSSPCPQWSLPFKLRVMLGLVRAVQRLGAKGVLHLDLKPDNVMLRQCPLDAAGPSGEPSEDAGVAGGI